MVTVAGAGGMRGGGVCSGGCRRLLWGGAVRLGQGGCTYEQERRVAVIGEEREVEVLP